MWYPLELSDKDSKTWEYTNRDRHFWPPPDTVPVDATLIIDVGANAGFSTALFASAWQNAKVVGLEMNPETAGRARQYLAEFGDRVQIITCTVGYPEREDVAYFTTANAVDHLVKYDWLIGEEHVVQVKTLDNILSENGYGEQKIDLLKMDIEGAEQEVLSGPCEWAKRTNVFVLEAHSYEHSSDDFVRLMENVGFTVSSNSWGQLIGLKS